MIETVSEEEFARLVGSSYRRKKFAPADLRRGVSDTFSDPRCVPRCSLSLSLFVEPSTLVDE